jgi:hypothetical protein
VEQDRCFYEEEPQSTNANDEHDGEGGECWLLQQKVNQPSLRLISKIITQVAFHESAQ